jgi:hypothetical protein
VHPRERAVGLGVVPGRVLDEPEAKQVDCLPPGDGRRLDAIGRECSFDPSPMGVMRWITLRSSFVCLARIRLIAGTLSFLFAQAAASWIASRKRAASVRSTSLRANQTVQRHDFAQTLEKMRAASVAPCCFACVSQGSGMTAASIVLCASRPIMSGN